jgi:drug/metabolite transporter (DMT)-like permease
VGTPRAHPAAFAGAIVALVGIVLLTGGGWPPLAGLGRGEWLTLAGAVAYALHLLTLSRAAGVISPRALGSLQIMVAAAVMLFFLPLEGAHRLHLSALVVFALLVTSLLATAAAFTIQSWAQQHLQPSHTALILALEPVFAALFSLLFLGERMGGRALAGAGLILAGILLAECGPTALSQLAILPVEPL